MVSAPVDDGEALRVHVKLRTARRVCHRARAVSEAGLDTLRRLALAIAAHGECGRSSGDDLWRRYLLTLATGALRLARSSLRWQRLLRLNLRWRPLLDLLLHLQREGPECEASCASQRHD